MADNPLGILGEKELGELLRKVDEAIADGQDLRKKIATAMADGKNAAWPDIERRQRPRGTAQSRP